MKIKIMDSFTHEQHKDICHTLKTLVLLSRLIILEKQHDAEIIGWRFNHALLYQSG